MRMGNLSNYVLDVRSGGQRIKSSFIAKAMVSYIPCAKPVILRTAILTGVLRNQGH
jgi:hypothetical protein